jgi:glycosyltransferase involved in cell wall biosynthesis
VAHVTSASSTASTARAGRSVIRVTHVVFDFNGGGMESLVAEMAARFNGTSVQVSLITLSGRVGRLGAVTRDRFDQFHVIRKGVGLSMLLPLGVAKVIRGTRADVVHVHNGSWYKGSLAARLAGVKRVIYTEHGREHDDPPFMQWLDRRASGRTDAVVAVSARLARYLEKSVGIERRRIVTIHNGVDTSVFTPAPPPAELRASLGIPSDALVIGSVGRLEPVKAYERLLEAAALLRGKLPRPFVVLICGSGSEREALEAHAARLGIGDIVRLPGWLDDPAQAYRLLDVFVLPSKSEGQSVSLMEAMASGVPAVVTDVGANAEMLGDELRAQVVSEQPAEMAKVIAATIGNEKTSNRMRQVVRERAVEHYSLDRLIKAYESLYRGTGTGPDYK